MTSVASSSSKRPHEVIDLTGESDDDLYELSLPRGRRGGGAPDRRVGYAGRRRSVISISRGDSESVALPRRLLPATTAAGLKGKEAQRDVNDMARPRSALDPGGTKTAGPSNSSNRSKNEPQAVAGGSRGHSAFDRIMANTAARSVAKAPAPSTSHGKTATQAIRPGSSATSTPSSSRTQARASATPSQPRLPRVSEDIARKRASAGVATPVRERDRNAQAGPSTPHSHVKPKVLPNGLVDEETIRPSATKSHKRPLPPSTPKHVAAAGVKRTHASAFTSPDKRFRTPGIEPPIGRELKRKMRDSPAEVSALLASTDLPQSPWHPKSRPTLQEAYRRGFSTPSGSNDRSRASGSKDRCTVTPTPTASQPRPPGRPSLPSGSTSVSPVLGRPFASVPHRPHTSQTRPREPSPLKQDITNGSRPSTSSPSSRKPLPPSAKSVPKPSASASSSVAALPDESSSSSRTALPASKEGESSRPRRAGPAPGAYTVPGMDAEHFGLPASSKNAALKTNDKATSAVASGSGRATAMPASPRPSHSPSSRIRPSTPSQSQTPAVKTVRTPGTPRDSSQGSRLHQSTEKGASRASATPRPAAIRPHPATASTSRKQSAAGALSTSRQTGSPSVPQRKTLDAMNTSSEEEEQVEEDEEEEPIENRPPALAKAQTPDDDDLMAQFRDIMSPINSQKSVRLDEVSQTPSRQVRAESKTPRAASLRLLTPQPQNNAIASSSTSSAPALTNVKVTITTPSQGKSEVYNFSPQSERQEVKDSVNDKLARALAGAKAQEKARREESDRRLKADLEAVEEAEEPDDMEPLSFDWSLGLLAPEREREDSAQAESVGSRRSMRIRNNSNRSDTHSLPPQQTAAKPARRKPAKSELFFGEQRKLQKQGIANGDAERVLRSLTKSMSPDKPERSYPTPDSDADSELSAESEQEEEKKQSDDDGVDDGDYGRLPEVNIDLLGQDGRFGGLLEVAREIKASRSVSARHTAASAVPEWDGFWSRAQATSTTTPPPSASAAPAIDSASVAKTVNAIFGQSSISPAARFACGLLTFGHENKPDVTLRDTLVAAVVEENESKRDVLADLMLRRIADAESNPLGSSADLVGLCASIWQACGARTALLGTFNSTGLPKLALPAQEAVGLTCEVLASALGKQWVDRPDATTLLPIMLLLAVDPATSKGLRRSAEEVVGLLCPFCIHDEDPTSLVQSLLEQFENVPSATRIQIIHAVGPKTRQSRQFARSLAIGWLLADSNVETTALTVDNILVGAVRLLTMVKQPDANYVTIDDYISLLYEALSDVASLVAQTPLEPEGHHPIMDLKSLITKIAHKLRPHGDDMTRLAISKSKSRVSQLAIVLEMQYEAIFKQVKRERIFGKLGERLKAGSGNQTRLSFAKGDDA